MEIDCYITDFQKF